MPCYRPLRAWQGKNGGAIRFTPSHTHLAPIDLACGQCIGCRLERSRQWAVRCTHEASMWDDNCFITLTYDDQNLPWSGSLVKQHFQKFMKRLRRHYEPKKIRYYMCGEYGPQLHRPHYHACLFNHDFDDKELWGDRDGILTFISNTLNGLWNKGFTTVSPFTYETAAYTARYIMKKITGDKKQEHYMHQVTEDLAIQLLPEYTSMSLKPGIGADWFETYKTDCYPSDFITHRGKKFRVPKYYDSLFEREQPDVLVGLKEKRQQNADKWQHQQTTQRLATREACTTAKISRMARIYEDAKQ